MFPAKKKLAMPDGLPATVMGRGGPSISACAAPENATIASEASNIALFILASL
jgi:hypothetical protein